MASSGSKVSALTLLTKSQEKERERADSRPQKTILPLAFSDTHDDDDIINVMNIIYVYDIQAYLCTCL